MTEPGSQTTQTLGTKIHGSQRTNQIAGAQRNSEHENVI